MAGIAGVPQGSAGDILIETENLTLLSQGQIGARNLVLSTGNAGNITVQGTNGLSNSLLIDGAGSGIFSRLKALVQVAAFSSRRTPSPSRTTAHCRPKPPA